MVNQMAKPEAEALEGKWGSQALCLGWVPVPASLLFLQSKLNISPTEMNVLINLLLHWWRAGDKVYPSQDAIAHRMGVSKRTVQRSMDKLEGLGLVERISTARNTKYRGRNIYNLEPLAKTLSLHAPVVKEGIGKFKGNKGERDD
jgi:predicted transcriptional regulator